MADNCFVDNCSIHWGVGLGVSGAAHEGTVQLATAGMPGGGSLACQSAAGAGQNAFAGGIGVLISADAGNLIVRHADGLYAQGIQSAVKALRVGEGVGGNLFNARTPLPSSTAKGADVNAPGKQIDAHGWSWTNSTGHDVVVIIRGQLRVRYAILAENQVGPTDVSYRPVHRVDDFSAGASDLTPFNMQLAIALTRTNTTIAGGDINSVIVEKFDASGVIIAVPSKVEVRDDWRDFEWTEGVSSGSTITLNCRAWFEGPDQSMNVITGTADTNTDYGFSLSNVMLYALPIQVSETAYPGTW